MTDSHLNHLRDLLTAFDATSLGEGDAVAGTNTLAAMAITISNIARPGSGIRTPEHARMRIGTSLLVSGSLSSSLVIDEVLTEACIRQNIFTTQLRRLSEAKDQEAQKQGLKAWSLPDGPGANGSEHALLNLHKKDPTFFRTTVEEWAKVVADPPNPRLEDLVDRPKLVIAATRAAELEKQLCALHQGQPLVLLGLTRPAEMGGLGPLCTAVMDGLLSAGQSGELVRGNLLITDPAGLLREVAKSTDHKTAWLARLVWLVDGNAGPECPEATGEKPAVGLDDLGGRFGTALSYAFAKRLDIHNPGPVLIDAELTKAQVRWIHFLQGMEDDLPDISGTARKLLATLAFGLTEMVRASKSPEGFSYSIPGIEALAQFLVLRMANARTAILWSAENSQRLKFKEGILHRLAEKDHTPSAASLEDSTNSPKDSVWNCCATMRRPGGRSASMRSGDSRRRPLSSSDPLPSKSENDCVPR